jgi:hypothetical protein
MKVAGVDASRIVVLAQSLGTAVASGIVERFAARGVDFAGVVLVSGFGGLRGMLADYAIAGLIPVMRPLKILFPWLLRRLLALIVDEWRSSDRLEQLVRTVKARDGRLRLSLVHAKDDWDIPWTEDDKMFAAAVKGTLEEDDDIDTQVLAEQKDKITVGRGPDAFVATWKDGDVVIRQELFPYGGEYLLHHIMLLLSSSSLTLIGHNNIMMYAPVSLAVMRSFDLGGTGDAECE